MKQNLFNKAREILAFADIEINGKRPFDMLVHDEAVYIRAFSEGSIGLGETYMEGLWDVEKLDEFFYKILQASLHKKVITRNLIMAILQAKILNKQTQKKSLIVAKKHYDLGNEFYTQMLDKRMIYSCAYWKNAKNLDEAQEHKLDLICRKIQLKPAEKVLDIGCGWGGFARYAAEKYGAFVTGITISQEQAEYAQQNCKGFPIEILLKDYREIQGTFDKIVSIGQFEHVGPKNYKTFFQIIDKCLKKDGLFLLHSIGAGKEHQTFDLWLDKYIFPNAHLPSINQINTATEGIFLIEDLHNFGTDYDKTLIAWFENFQKNWPEIKKNHGFDERFYRMWKYYLLMCAGTFRSRLNQLWQIVFSKGRPKGYISIR